MRWQNTELKTLAAGLLSTGGSYKPFFEIVFHINSHSHRERERETIYLYTEYRGFRNAMCEVSPSNPQVQNPQPL
jgi:hypothetical protein